MDKKSLKVKIFLNLLGTYEEVRNTAELYATIMETNHKKLVATIKEGLLVDTP